MEAPIDAGALGVYSDVPTPARIVERQGEYVAGDVITTKIIKKNEFSHYETVGL